MAHKITPAGWQGMMEGRPLGQPSSERQRANTHGSDDLMLRFTSARHRLLLLATTSLIVGCGSAAANRFSTHSLEQRALPPAPIEHILAYQARFGRQKPVIAIVGINAGTELTDYVIPYGVLRQAAVGEVIAVATGVGPMTMRPALQIQPQASMADFDARFPGGADYVVVPAVVKRDDPVLLTWIKQQAAKGSTLVSICDGAAARCAQGF